MCVRGLSSAAAGGKSKWTTPEGAAKLRNVAIIAHVDHGKTTLVDCLLHESGGSSATGGGGEGSTSGARVMDSNVLEKERGITITSKNTSIEWEGHRLNIVDTPGHADFGGEVERIMSMVDGVVLVVDATDGPMTQTKFVLGKALAHGLTPMVVINKVDRPTARLDDVENEVFDLFLSLDASDEQMEYPVMYASAKNGWAVTSLDDIPAHDDTAAQEAQPKSMRCVLDMITETVPPPKVDFESPFKMLVTQVTSNTFLGKGLVGRVTSGIVRVGDQLRALDPEGNVAEQARVTKLFVKRGLSEESVEEAGSGDIVSISGFSEASVRSTICDPEVSEAIPSVPIDPPTVSVMCSPNTSPLSGRDGDKVTVQAILDRLTREVETNVSLRMIRRDTEAFEIQARGELQLGILFEEIRREGFELSVSAPQVVYRKASDNSPFEHRGEHLKASVLKELLEPVEEVSIEVDDSHAGTIVEKMKQRRADLLQYEQSNTEGRSKLVFRCPTRGLIGFSSEFQNDTRGSGLFSSTFLEYVPYVGPIEPSNRGGAMISTSTGKTTAYALSALEPRGTLFVPPGVEVYGGMVIGEHSRAADIDVNPAKAKALTNVRASGSDEKIILKPHRHYGIEEAISVIRDDMMVEVTPSNIRLRMRELDPGQRKRNRRG